MHKFTKHLQYINNSISYHNDTQEPKVFALITISIEETISKLNEIW